MKHTRFDIIALAAVLFCAISITVGFLIYDQSQPHYKNNTKYQFSLPQTSEEASEIVGAGEDIVYLSPSGSKYHHTKDCSALARSKVVRSVSKEKALLLGKEPCSKCFK